MLFLNASILYLAGVIPLILVSVTFVFWVIIFNQRRQECFKLLLDFENCRFDGQEIPQGHQQQVQPEDKQDINTEMGLQHIVHDPDHQERQKHNDEAAVQQLGAQVPGASSLTDGQDPEEKEYRKMNADLRAQLDGVEKKNRSLEAELEVTKAKLLRKDEEVARDDRWSRQYKVELEQAKRSRKLLQKETDKIERELTSENDALRRELEEERRQHRQELERLHDQLGARRTVDAMVQTDLVQPSASPKPLANGAKDQAEAQPAKKTSPKLQHQELPNPSTSATTDGEAGQRANADRGQSESAETTTAPDDCASNIAAKVHSREDTEIPVCTEEGESCYDSVVREFALAHGTFDPELLGVVNAVEDACIDEQRAIDETVHLRQQQQTNVAGTKGKPQKKVRFAPTVDESTSAKALKKSDGQSASAVTYEKGPQGAQKVNKAEDDKSTPGADHAAQQTDSAPLAAQVSKPRQPANASVPAAAAPEIPKMGQGKAAQGAEATKAAAAKQQLELQTKAEAPSQQSATTAETKTPVQGEAPTKNLEALEEQPVSAAKSAPLEQPATPVANSKVAEEPARTDGLAVTKEKQSSSPPASEEANEGGKVLRSRRSKPPTLYSPPKGATPHKRHTPKVHKPESPRAALRRSAATSYDGRLQLLQPSPPMQETRNAAQESKVVQQSGDTPMAETAEHNAQGGIDTTTGQRQAATVPEPQASMGVSSAFQAGDSVLMEGIDAEETGPASEQTQLGPGQGQTLLGGQASADDLETSHLQAPSISPPFIFAAGSIKTDCEKLSTIPPGAKRTRADISRSLSKRSFSDDPQGLEPGHWRRRVPKNAVAVAMKPNGYNQYPVTGSESTTPRTTKGRQDKRTPSGTDMNQHVPRPQVVNVNSQSAAVSDADKGKSSKVAEAKVTEPRVAEPKAAEPPKAAKPPSKPAKSKGVTTSRGYKILDLEAKPVKLRPSGAKPLAKPGTSSVKKSG